VARGRRDPFPTRVPVCAACDAANFGSGCDRLYPGSVCSVGRPMKRREVLIGLAAIAAPRPALAQSSPRLPVVAFVGFASAPVDNRTLEPFRHALRELGQVEGRTVVIKEARAAMLKKVMPSSRNWQRFRLMFFFHRVQRRRARSCARPRFRSSRSPCPLPRVSPSCLQPSLARAAR
jgi:hypothetical protein